MLHPLPNGRSPYLTSRLHISPIGLARGFGFIRMSTVEEATKCINELNGIVRTFDFLRVFLDLILILQDLNGRRIRVDYSVTDRPHAPTPGEYMGHHRSSHRDSYYGRDSRHYHDGHDYRDRGPGYSDRDRDPYGRDGRDRDRDWCRSPPPPRHSPDYRRRKSHSRSPPRGSSPTRALDTHACRMPLPSTINTHTRGLLQCPL